MKALFTILLFVSLSAHGQIKRLGQIYGGLRTQNYTLSATAYPLDVFDVAGKNIAIAADSSQFVQGWNAGNPSIGTLQALSAFLFKLTLRVGQTAPASLQFRQITTHYISLSGNHYLITGGQNLIIAQ